MKTTTTNLTYFDTTFGSKDDVKSLLERVRKENIERAEAVREINKSYRVVNRLFGLTKAN